MIWIILLGGMVQGAFAQNLEIKGMVRDARNKEILEFANVVLQTMDSSFVAGTTTDMKGHFLLNKIKKGSYILSVSSLGFKTEYISLEGLSKNISLGEISLNDDAVSLDGVTVSIICCNKSIPFPEAFIWRSDGKTTFLSAWLVWADDATESAGGFVEQRDQGHGKWGSPSAYQWREGGTG